MNAQRFLAIARKEWIHVLRDWRSLFLTVAIPMVLILLFGYALNMDLRNVPAVVWDQSRTSQSRDLLELFDGSPYFSINTCCDSYDGIQSALDSGTAMIALVIPHDFASRIEGSQPVKIQVIGRQRCQYCQACPGICSGHRSDVFRQCKSTADSAADRS